MRGRKPKPTYLRVLDGKASHGHKPNPDEPIPDGDLNDPPPELDARQAAIWRHAIENAPPGMLKKIDRSVFSTWVAAVDAFEQARAKVAHLGLLVKGPQGGYMQNPYLAIQNKQNQLIRQAAAELGFSPTSRTRVKVPKAKKTANAFADLKSLDD